MLEEAEAQKHSSGTGESSITWARAKGYVIYSNLSNPIFLIVADDVRRHDLSAAADAR
jgi:hypothetical protein